jgi:alpha-D-xyloside xylohydrolase
MKFTDGYWQIRRGVQPLHPAALADVTATSETLALFAATRRLDDRGDTLNHPLLAVKISAPMADVLCVQLSHWAGDDAMAPAFAVEHTPGEVIVNIDAEVATIASGRLSARINRSGPWAIDYFAGGELVTRSGWKGMGVVEVAGEGCFTHEQLQLAVGECAYGLGERFTAFVKNGQSVDIWNEDGGTASEQAYKNVPFYLTNRGYGVFVADPGAVSFEVASEKVERVQFSAPGKTLTYYLIYGPTPKEVLYKYTALTGRPALPPAWSFGLWLSTSFTTRYDETTVTGFIQGMADREIPLSVFHFDCFWMREFHWCDFVWDPACFPDPAAMLARLKARGLKICVWINPYIGQRSHLFAEGKAGGYLLKRADGSVWQTDKWQAGMGIVDFTNPDACAWFTGQLRTLLEQGVDCFKTDFGERIPVNGVVWHDGADPVKMHNYYAHLYNQTVFHLLEAERGTGEAVVFARAATTGGQQFPVHWGGDCESTFEGMAETLRGGLSLTLSGFGFWSHDIGGFEGKPRADLYKRWVAFGLLSSHSRLHGSGSYRVPWLFDEEAVTVLRQFVQLKCRLMPYLFAQAVVAAQTGIPVMRAMLLEFPDDPACDYLDRQYLLGESLLVAPVFSAGGRVNYYVPAGRWTHLLTGAVVNGPGWVQEIHDFLSLPLLVRPNSLLATGAVVDRPDYDFADGVTIEAFELADGAELAVSVPDVNGQEAARFLVQRQGDRVSAQRQGLPGAWRLRLVGHQTTGIVEGGSVEQRADGAIVTAGGGRLQVTMTV